MGYQTHLYQFFIILKSVHFVRCINTIKKSALDFKTIHSPEFSSFENHTVCLTLDGRRLFLGVIYRPPASSVVKFFEDFLSYVGFLSSLSPSFVICGDFNLHVDIMSPTVSEFKSVMDSCCLSQYIDFPTHLHGHTLDLLKAPSEFSAISDVKGSGFISDHKIISCVVDFPSLDTPIQKVVTFRQYHKLNTRWGTRQKLPCCASKMRFTYLCPRACLQH